MGVDPITIALVATAVSTAVGATAAYGNAKAQKQNAKYQAAVARNNSIYAEQAAQRNEALAADAIQRGRTEELRQRQRTLQLAAKQRAGYAAGGVDVSVGSPLDIIGDTFELGELDALTVRNNAAREANSYENAAWQNRVQGTNYVAQSDLLSTQAKNISPGMDAFGVVLDGVSTMASIGASGKGSSMKGKTETINWSDGTSGTYRYTGQSF